MRILGLSGWYDRGHEAAACLLQDGKLIAMAEEERFVRKKHAYDLLPYNASQFCLNAGNVSLEDVDYIAVYWDFPLHYTLRGLTWKHSAKEVFETLFPKKLFKHTICPKVEFLNHHLCHAASAFRASGFDRAAILVMDGQGEDASTSLGYGNGNEIFITSNMDISSSLGYFYGAATRHLGFAADEAGKTMGLAAYGKVISGFDPFRLTNDSYKSIMPKTQIKLGLNGISDEEQQVVDYWLNQFTRKFGPSNFPQPTYSKEKRRFLSKLRFGEKHKDFAASAQRALENVVLHLAKLVIEKTGCKNLCIAGGVGLNCLANSRILESNLADEIFVQPAANDAGCCLGAALELYARLGYKSRIRLNHAFFGPAFSDKEILEAIRFHKLAFEYYDDVAGFTGELLMSNKIVGWFQGQMEFGPRALGHRSILTNPCDRSMKNKLNSRVKFRESFRPFAPSILDEGKEEILVNARSSPFMLLSFSVKESIANRISAVVHVDGTTRPQTVEKGVDPIFHRLLTSFANESGIPCILNTSFNTRGEPIVCTPYDAIATFFRTGMDCLVLGNYLVKK